jgi:hypothetical protein
VGEPTSFVLHRFVEAHVDGAGWLPSDPGHSVHFVTPAHVVLALDDEPYDPEWQRELVVTTLEAGGRIEASGPAGAATLAVRAWSPSHQASTMTR